MDTYLVKGNYQDKSGDSATFSKTFYDTDGERDARRKADNVFRNMVASGKAKAGTLRIVSIRKI